MKKNFHKFLKFFLAGFLFAGTVSVAAINNKVSETKATLSGSPTIAELLCTNSDFPGEGGTYWTNDNGCVAYLGSSDLHIDGTSDTGMFAIDVPTSYESPYYTKTMDGVLLKFHVDTFGVLESIVVDSGGVKDYDGAFHGVRISEVIGTNPDFPTTSAAGWEAENGNKAYFVANSLGFLPPVYPSTVISGSTALMKSGQNYVVSSDHITVTFTMTNGVLSSITYFNDVSDAYNGTYEAGFKTIKNVLDTVKDFPTEEIKGWITNNGYTAYIDTVNSKLIFNYEAGETTAQVGLDTAITKVNSTTYTCSSPSITFTLNDGVLVSIAYNETGLLNGTYVPSYSLESVLALAEGGFPNNLAYAWNYETHRMYYDTSSKNIVITKNGGNLEFPTRPLFKDGEKYIYAENNSSKFSFNVSDGKLVSVNLKGYSTSDSDLIGYYVKHNHGDLSYSFGDNTLYIYCNESNCFLAQDPIVSYEFVLNNGIELKVEKSLDISISIRGEDDFSCLETFGVLTVKNYAAVDEGEDTVYGNPLINDKLTVTEGGDYVWKIVGLDNDLDKNVKFSKEIHFTVESTAFDITNNSLEEDASENHGYVAILDSEENPIELAAKDEIVTVETHANKYYVLDSISVVDGDGNPVSVNENHTFSMPSSEVTVSASFRRENITVALASAPNKLVYNVGENLDLTGAVVTVSYEFSEPQTITVTSEMISGYYGNNIGSQTITIAYKGATCSFDVSVEAEGISGGTVALIVVGSVLVASIAFIAVTYIIWSKKGYAIPGVSIVLVPTYKFIKKIVEKVGSLFAKK